MPKNSKSAPYKASSQDIQVVKTDGCALVQHGQNWVVNNPRDDTCFNTIAFEARSPTRSLMKSLGHIACKEIASFDKTKKSLQISSLVVRVEQPFDIALTLLSSVESYAKSHNFNYVSILPVPSRKQFFTDFQYNNTFDNTAALYKVFERPPSVDSDKIDYSPDTSFAISYIRRWTTTVYYAFNRSLRQSAMTPAYANFYKGMMLFFEKYAIDAPLKRGVEDLLQLDASRRIYRGISPADREDDNASAMDLFKNGRLDDKGFIAFSKDETLSRRFATKGTGKGLFLTFNIMTDFAPGTKIVDIEAVSTYGAEREILAMPGTIELVEQIDTNDKFDTWRARYIPAPKLQLQEIGFSGGGGGLFPSMQLETQGKLAVYYNIIQCKILIHKVETIDDYTDLADTIAYLDVKQERLRSVTKEWAALRQLNTSVVLADNTPAPALLTNVSVAIVNTHTKQIEAWRYGDLNDLPDDMKNGIAFAEALKRYAS